MSSFTNNIRGTVQGVVGAASHVIWWVSWRTGATDAVRTLPERQTA
jgi:hypothetical protein